MVRPAWRAGFPAAALGILRVWVGRGMLSGTGFVSSQPVRLTGPDPAGGKGPEPGEPSGFKGQCSTWELDRPEVVIR